jgi:hypothetical protein
MKNDMQCNLQLFELESIEARVTSIAWAESNFERFVENVASALFWVLLVWRLSYQDNKALSLRE